MVSSPWTGKPLKCLWMDKKSYTVISVSLSGYIISKTVIRVQKCSVQCLFSMSRYLSEKKEGFTGKEGLALGVYRSLMSSPYFS